MITSQWQSACCIRRSPCLIAIGGLSGSGKSALAMALAPSIGAVPGALVLRSDEIRKRLCGVSPLQRLGPEGYTPDGIRPCLCGSCRPSQPVVRSGHSAIVDAVHARPADRQAIERLAGDASVPFIGLWLEAPETVLIERTKRRRLDPSDADETVIRTQRAQDIGVDRLASHRCIVVGGCGATQCQGARRWPRLSRGDCFPGRSTSRPADGHRAVTNALGGARIQDIATPLDILQGCPLPQC